MIILYSGSGYKPEFFGFGSSDDDELLMMVLGDYLNIGRDDDKLTNEFKLCGVKIEKGERRGETGLLRLQFVLGFLFVFWFYT